ncbi:MAG: hypothetical protein NC934_06795 [Candidatus Omnitrophica bacterium]|nr:hypothetical protein [Candidatus Omnitrophota bacterium]
MNGTGEISKDVFEKKLKGQWIRIIGKELFNVLVCDLDVQYCNIEIITQAPPNSNIVQQNSQN